MSRPEKLTGGRVVRAPILWPLVALGAVLLFNAFFNRSLFHLEWRDGRLYGSLVDILNRGTPVMLLNVWFGP